MVKASISEVAPQQTAHLHRVVRKTAILEIFSGQVDPAQESQHTKALIGRSMRNVRHGRRGNGQKCRGDGKEEEEETEV